MSGLALNIKKCVIIPVHLCELPSVKTWLSQTVPGVADMTIASSGIYLGFAVGSGKGDATWIKPTTKYIERAADWKGLPLGLQYDALVYNTFSISVLSYVCHLEYPPAWALEKEKEGLRLSVSGPGFWCVPADLWRLRESFGTGSIVQVAGVLGKSGTTSGVRMRSSPASGRWLRLPSG